MDGVVPMCLCDTSQCPCYCLCCSWPQLLGPCAPHWPLAALMRCKFCWHWISKKQTRSRHSHSPERPHIQVQCYNNWSGRREQERSSAGSDDSDVVWLIVCGGAGVGGGGDCLVSLHPLHTVIWILMVGIKQCPGWREKMFIELMLNTLLTCV